MCNEDKSIKVEDLEAERIRLSEEIIKTEEEIRKEKEKISILEEEIKRIEQNEDDGGEFGFGGDWWKKK